MTDFLAERETMIESQIRPNSVTNTALLKAIFETPREAFVPPSLRSLAYIDAPLKVEPAGEQRHARYLLSPMIFAKLAQLARIQPADRVLDVGPASGYSTAVLARLAKEVVALEHDAGLAAIAADALEGEKVGNCRFVIGAHDAGAPDHAPFDVIFINGRLEVSPTALLAQLAPRGRLVAILGGPTAAKARLFTRIDKTIQETVAFDAGAPVLPGFEGKQAFTF